MRQQIQEISSCEGSRHYKKLDRTLKEMEWKEEKNERREWWNGEEKIVKIFQLFCREDVWVTIVQSAGRKEKRRMAWLI